MDEFTGKVMRSASIVAEVVENNLIRRCYVAYSGGADSRALLYLVRSLCPGIIAVHNKHPGEFPTDVGGMIETVEPKNVIVPIFLKTVDFHIQFDGTRRDEDKTVIFDGKEIHRSEMPGSFTTNGVYGLSVYFPLLDWTCDDVLRYLNEKEKSND